jgi:hypothetical protein
MTLPARIVSEIASELGIVPLVWLAWRALRGHRSLSVWWWMAAVFGVSWAADTAAIWNARWLISAVYPATQATLVGIVFLAQSDALVFLIVLTMVGAIDVILHSVTGPNVLLRTVAWLAIVGIAGDRPGLGALRWSLLVSFGVGWLAWLGYATWPGWTSWLIYQAVRAIGIGLFCWAASHPAPFLRPSVSP